MIHFSLFSGIGGFDLASEWMGWKNYLSCEINEFGNKILEYYWADAYHHRDIHTLTYETIDIELSRRFGSDWRNDDIILTGGFPCQPYSMAGKRLGKEDERHLFPEMLRVIREVQPKWIVGENVLGIVNWSGGLVFEEVQADLEAQGYEVQSYVLPAVSVNAPHRRDRVWFVAYSVGQRFKEQGEQPIRRDKEQFEWSILQQFAPHPNGNPKGTPGESTSTTRNRSNINVQQSERGSKTELNIRPSSIPRNVADTDSRRLEGSVEVGRNCEYVERKDGTIAEGGTPPDTESEQSERFELGKQPETCTQKQGESGRNNSKSITSDPCKIGFSGEESERKLGGKQRFAFSYEPRIWEKFPTQSPVCNGDDGISSRLDGITFPKWRQESIKGGGNAIVPQVCIQIFKSIEQYELSQQPPDPMG
jgi:DNA (cytosine-5)-methyltransferase 1